MRNDNGLAELGASDSSDATKFAFVCIATAETRRCLVFPSLDAAKLLAVALSTTAIALSIAPSHLPLLCLLSFSLQGESNWVSRSVFCSVAVVSVDFIALGAIVATSLTSIQ